MNIDDIITLEDNKEYVILDKSKYNNENYLYCVQLDPEGNPTDNYEFLKEVKEDNEYFVEDIAEELKDEIEILFTTNYFTNEEQDV